MNDSRENAARHFDLGDILTVTTGRRGGCVPRSEGPSGWSCYCGQRNWSKYVVCEKCGHPK